MKAVLLLCAVLALGGADAPPESETWRFDRLDSIGGHATKILGHPQVIDTNLGKALWFDGAQDAVQLDVHPLAGAKAFTLEMIFRPDSGGGVEQRFFHLQEVDPATGSNTATRMLFELRVIDGRWAFDGVAFSGSQSKTLLDRGKVHSLDHWHAGALVYDGRELSNYVDGVRQGAAEVHLEPQGNGRTSIGTRIDLRSYFKGAVYEARMTRRALAPSEFLTVPHFREHAIAAGLRGGYQVAATDLNHDGKPDLIALATSGNELYWFENPGWERHTLAVGFAHMINCVAVGADGDGIPEIVLASEFANVAKNSIGVVSVLRHDGDPRRPWKAQEIDRISTSHRLRLADIDGRGKPVVINAALTGPQAEPPDFRGETPLVYYRPGVWKRETILPANSGLVHGIYVLDWDGDHRDEILSAGFEGIHLFKLAKDGWTRTPIAAGDPAPWPKSGSSDVTVGRIGGERFLAAIEPWHGNEVAIYRQRGGGWDREVTDATLADGHTIQTIDLDGSGNDSVVAGYRGGEHNLYLYRFDPAAGNWTRQALDRGGMGAAACVVVDLNGDGRPDIACIGSATANLKWYENLGPTP
jgi:Concanavalin A-like lectin/glucanases superfamily/FG-GAP-like repeat/FG-GAP repeat